MATIEKLAKALDVSVAEIIGVDSDIKYKAQEVDRKLQLLEKIIKETSNVTPISKPLTTIPVYGKVPAGMPREAWHDYIWEYISVPDVSDKAFGLVVSGDSMVGEDITEGDIVVIEPNMESHNGDIVVAVIDGSEFTLKKFYKDKDHIILAPANEHYQPIIFSLESFDNRVMILGVMVGVYKRYKKRKIF
jgi:repressor LexA